MKVIRIFALIAGFYASAIAAAEVPQVLIIADSIHSTTAKAAAAELKGRAKVVTSSINLGHTGMAISQLDKLLGKKKWDLIHFNFGFADLRHIDPKTKSLRLLSRHAGGVRVTTPEQYEANLRKIVSRLKETGAQLVWASTTPLVGSKYDSILESGSEKVYNAIALEIMHQEKIPVNDMHAWVIENVKKISDPLSYRKIDIHIPVVDSIEKVLKLPKKQATIKK